MVKSRIKHNISQWFDWLLTQLYWFPLHIHWLRQEGITCSPQTSGLYLNEPLLDLSSLLCSHRRLYLRQIDEPLWMKRLHSRSSGRFRKYNLSVGRQALTHSECNIAKKSIKLLEPSFTEQRRSPALVRSAPPQYDCCCFWLCDRVSLPGDFSLWL